jgi:hypothetical protein
LSNNRIKNVACDILSLRRVAIATFSVPPQCDPRGAFFTYQDNFNKISWYGIKNVACDILRLRRVAIATFSVPPQCDPRGAFFTYQDNFNKISW